MGINSSKEKNRICNKTRTEPEGSKNDSQVFCLTNLNHHHQHQRHKDKSISPLNSFEYPNYGSNDDKEIKKSTIDNDIENQQPKGEENIINVATIIGQIGWFQLLVLVFSGLRECLVGYDALITSIMLQPETGYLCTSGLSAISAKADNDNDDPGLQVAGRRHGGNYIYNSNIQNVNDSAQCSYFVVEDNNNTENKTELPCNSWSFPASDPNRASLIVEWSLVCDRSFYPALIESSFFMGLLLGNMIWGYMADRIGRKKAYIISHSIAIVAGSMSLIISDVRIFAIFRFLSALGSVGYNILYTIQMELIGTKHRSYATMFNHLGWGMGAISIPLMARLTNNTRLMLSVSPIVSIFMLPGAFWLPESSRWLMARGKFSQARKELIRAARFNGKEITPKLESLIISLNEKIAQDKTKQQQQYQIAKQPPSPPLVTSNHNNRDQTCDNTSQTTNNSSSNSLITKSEYSSSGSQSSNCNNKISRNSISLSTEILTSTDHDRSHSITSSQASEKSTNYSTYRILCTNPVLIKDTLIISYSAFLGHLFYYLLTINFSDTKNLSIEANFISSGAGEWFSLAFGALLLRYLTRRTSMAICLFTMASSFLFQCMIDSGLMPTLNNPLIVTINNSIGTVSSLLLVFVVLIVNQEVYPTVIRQTGSSIGNTLGELGSTLAPWLIQLNRSIGLWRADLLCATMCLMGMIGSQFLTKTDNVELADI